MRIRCHAVSPFPVVGSPASPFIVNRALFKPYTLKPNTLKPDRQMHIRQGALMFSLLVEAGRMVAGSRCIEQPQCTGG
jgi:hypothetical protein